MNNMNKTSFELLTKDDSKDVDQEEAFYYHTINAFAALIVVYGYNNVIRDLKLKLKERP